MSVLAQQTKIVEERLSYHFGGIAEKWNIPPGMPYMNEFLNEVEQLCRTARVADKMLETAKGIVEFHVDKITKS